MLSKSLLKECWTPKESKWFDNLPVLFYSFSFVFCLRVKNLKEAKNCHIAGGAKKLTGVSPELMAKINLEVKGEVLMKVLRIVKSGKVFYPKEYIRMVKCNAHVVLFESGKVWEIEFFVWDRQTGIMLAVFSEIQPDLKKPFFFCEAGHHTLRMKQERYYFTWHVCIIRFRLVT